jgi:hypothetical protein
MTSIKNYIVYITVFFLALVSAPWSLNQAVAEEKGAYINYSVTINVREGQGVGFRPVGSVRPGEPVRILEREAGWVKIQPIGKGLVGWVAASFVTQGRLPLVPIEDYQSAIAQKEAQIEALKHENDSLKKLVGTIPKRFLNANIPFEEALKRQLNYYDQLLRLKWFMGGGSVFLVGLLIGVIIGRNRRKSKKRLMLD